MSYVVVCLPDDGWIKSGSNIEPDDKMLCVVIDAYGDQAPGIYQFRKADWLHPDGDYFLDVGERWRLAGYEAEGEWNPEFMTWGAIGYWKPLGLPPKENQRLLKEIETWFGNDK